MMNKSYFNVIIIYIPLCLCTVHCLRNILLCAYVYYYSYATFECTYTDSECYKQKKQPLNGSTYIDTHKVYNYSVAFKVRMHNNK